MLIYLFMTALCLSHLSRRELHQTAFIYIQYRRKYSEKDRIIENTIYTVSIELKLQTNIELRPIIFSRYSEAIALIIQKNDMWIDCKITNSEGNKIVMRITV